MLQYAPQTFLCATSLTFSASATCHIHIQSPTIYSTILVIYGAPILCPVSVPRRRSNSFINWTGSVIGKETQDYSKFWIKKTNRI